MYKIYLVVLFLLSSCSGGSNSLIANTPSSAAFQAGLTMGDLGVLCINTNTVTVPATSSCNALAPLSYSLTVTHSSFGLVGNTFSGSMILNSDGTYSTSDGNQIYSFPNYIVMVMKLTRALAPDYFALNSGLINTQFVHVPVIALNASSLINSVDQLTSNDVSTEFREVSMTFHASNPLTANSYIAEGSKGSITKISNNSFSVALCSNNGDTSQNFKITNCSIANATSKVFTYNSITGSWQTTWDNALAYPNQVANAYFVKDTTANTVFGYIDISDSSKSSSGFSIVQIAPPSLTFPAITGANPTVNFYNYSTCVDSLNCGDVNGVEIYLNEPFSNNSSKQTTWQSDGPCTTVTSFDNPSSGFIANYFDNSTPGNGLCNQPGSGGDNIMIFFGNTTSSQGKLKTMIAAAGWDKTVTTRPSQKLSVVFLNQN